MKFKIRGIPIGYFFKPKYWMSYIRGKAIGNDITEEYFNQVMMRYTNPNCQRCVELGKCVNCGCETWPKMLDPYSVCENPQNEEEPFWGPMLSAKAFRDVKNIEGIKFKTIYSKKVSDND